MQQEEKLQAICLLDSYSNKFEPLSSSRAECLLPLVDDRTLLDYNVELLIENDVKEIVLFCTRHHNQIKNHIEKKDWRSRVEIHFVYNFKCRSLGDAMREIEAKNLIRSTFILITATSIVSNIKLTDYLEQHKLVCKSDKNVIMTMLCTENNNNAVVSAAGSTSSVFVHNGNKRILYYKSSCPKAKSTSFVVSSAILTAGQQQLQAGSAVQSANARFNLQSSALQATSGYQNGNFGTVGYLNSVQLRADLTETEIYFCSPHVLHLFTDNFDRDSMEEFIIGTLNDEEISGQTIQIDLVKVHHGHHFSLITDLNSYFNETMRLIQRTDLLLDFDNQPNYKRLDDRINVHVSKTSTKLGAMCKTDRNVFVESHCRIGTNCELTNCYLGANCVIGNNVKLTNSIVWPNCRVGDNCQINGCMLGYGVKVGNNVRLAENSLFGNECQIKDNTQMTQRAVYVTRRERRISESESASRNLNKQMSNLAVAGAKYEITEDNYVKYTLSDKISMDENEDDDDDFGTDDEDQDIDQDDDDDDEDDNESQKSIGCYDTSKNKHFYVWDFTGHDHAHVDSDASSDEEDQDEDDDDDDDEEVYGDEDDDDGELADKTDKGDFLEEEARLFFNEVVESLELALNKNISADSTILEINSRKHANNIQIDELCYYLGKAMLYLPIHMEKKATRQEPDLSKFNYLAKLKEQLVKKKSIIKNYYASTDRSQMKFLNAHLSFFIETSDKLKAQPNYFIDTYYVKTLHFMFNDIEFLKDNVILAWYEEKQSQLENPSNANADDVDPARKKYCIGKLTKFIEWLQEDEDEDDDDDDE